MKRILLSKLENDFLKTCLEEYLEKISDTELVDQKWLDELQDIRKLFDLELDNYKIRNDGMIPTKKQMVKWLIIKIKNKTADLS